MIRPTYAQALNLAWRVRSTPARRRFEKALADPRPAQERVLSAMLASCRQSDFAAQHGLANAVSIEDWRRRVPVRDWDELSPWLRRIEQGEANVLSELPTSRLVPTSGSSSARKLIPYNALLMSQLRESLDAWIGELFRRQPALMAGPAYWGVSPAIPPRESDAAMAVPVGFDDDSEYVGGRLAPLLEKALAVPSAVREVQDTDAFRYVTLLFLLESSDLTLISIWHPSFLELLLDALPQFFDSLVRDVFDGTIRPDTIGPDTRLPAALAARLRAGRPAARDRKRRARALESCGPDDLRTIWPRLQMVSCWTDGSAALPAKRLASRLGTLPIAPKGLLATEAFVSFPFCSGRPAAVTGHLIEFEDSEGSAHFCWQVEKGQRYTVVVTTGSGLQRYRLSDIVEVTGFEGLTPCLQFIARSQTTDLCGEKLSEELVAAVLPSLLDRFAASRNQAGSGSDSGSESTAPAFALLAPEHLDLPRYTLYLEVDGLDQGLDTSDRGWTARALHLAQQLDRELSANPHWELARRLGQLGPPQVYGIAPRTARASYEARFASEGMRLGDIKPALLSNRTDWSSWFQGSYVNCSALEVSRCSETRE